ncbi:MAG: Holliday junction resolvase RuvX [Candidatus Nomurabacteria bacterium]|nr:Holliday junction resolvase RuvX [Candidatus Nomurabacteria bacterium]
MRFLSIDFGMKRIGIAISDEGGTLAFPKEIILNTKDNKVLDRIGEIIKIENVSEIVIGESVDFSGRLNMLMSHIELFITDLENAFHLPVHRQKEFLTSVEARRSKTGKKDMSPSQAHSKLKDTKAGRVDAGAAALILQRYLDKNNKLLEKK